MTITAEQAIGALSIISRLNEGVRYIETTDDGIDIYAVQNAEDTMKEAAAMMAALAELNRVLAAKIERLTSERDEAVARAAAAYEDAALMVPNRDDMTGIGFEAAVLLNAERRFRIRCLTTDDGAAALARRDAKMKAAGMREAAMVRVSADWIGMCPMPERWRNAILARADEIERRR